MPTQNNIMAKFLKTTGVSHYLEELINNSEKELILISPFLKFNDRIKKILEDKDRWKIDVRVVYGKNDLQLDENNWLKGLKSIRSSFIKNLHAKCYLNENEAIITSMNLYDFSQVNNNEMGIHVKKDEDAELYEEIYKEARRLIRDSDEVEVTVTKKPKKSISRSKTGAGGKGHCIRCDTTIKLNPVIPYCKKCFTSWNEYKNPEHVEKNGNCHVCGTDNPSKMISPACFPCYKKNKTKLEWPTP